MSDAHEYGREVIRHVNEIVSQAEQLPQLSDAEIRQDFNDVQSVWNAEKILLLSETDLRASVITILVLDQGEGFGRVQCVADAPYLHGKFFQFNTMSDTHFRGHRIARTKSGRFALFGHESTYRHVGTIEDDDGAEVTEISPQRPLQQSATQNAECPPRSASRLERYDVILKVFCLAMCVDGRVSRSERNRILDFMQRLKSPWTIEEANARIDRFLAGFDEHTFERTLQYVAEKTPQVLGRRQRAILLKCLEAVIDADGRREEIEVRFLTLLEQVFARAEEEDQLVAPTDGTLLTECDAELHGPIDVVPVEIGSSSPTNPCLATIPVDFRTDAVALSPDGRLAFSRARYGQYMIQAWDTSTGERVAVFCGHSADVYCIQLSRDGRHLLSGACDATAKLWDIATAKCLHTLGGHEGAVCAVAISGNGRIALTGSTYGDVSLWDLSSGSRLDRWRHSEDGSEVKAVALSGDGSCGVIADAHNTISFWDFTISDRTRFESHCRWSVKGLSGSVVSGFSFYEVRSVALTGDGKSVIYCGNDPVVRKLDAADGKLAMNLRGHADWVHTVCLSADDRYVLSGGKDKTICLWNHDFGSSPLREYMGHTDAVWSVSLSADNRYALSGGDDKTLRWWTLDGSAPKRVESTIPAKTPPKPSPPQTQLPTSNPPRIHRGMSESIVEALLGKPKSKRTEGDMLAQLARNASDFAGHTSSRVFAVYDHPAGRYEIVYSRGAVVEVHAQP